MKMTSALSVLSVLALVFLCSIVESPAQARRVAQRAVETGDAVQTPPGKEGVFNLKIEAIGQNTKVRTPEFKSDSAEVQAQVKDWARVTSHYDTDADWINELEFRYMVLVQHPKTLAYTMFPATVNYIEIPKGKRHVSTVFLRPNTLARYGNVVWAGVKVYIKGKDAPVATAQMPEKDLNPWTANVNTREGLLLNRSQTPFAMLAINNYETIKPK